MTGCCEMAPPVAGEPGAAPTRERTAEWVRLAIGVVLAGLSMQLSLGINTGEAGATTRLIVHGVLAGAAAVAFGLLGWPLCRAAAGALRRGRITLDGLFLVAMAGALGASVVHTVTGAGAVFYEVVTVLVTVHAFGRLVVERQRKRATGSLQALNTGLRTATRLTCCGRAEETPLAEVRRGDRIRVRSGEVLPVDGVVAEGVAYVQELAHTGEPFPAVREAGDRVMAGSRALDGELVIAADHDGAGREIDRMSRRLDQALAGAGRWQREADRALAWFVPGVLVVAVATYAFWTWRGAGGDALFHALAVLLVACPCGLGVGLPAAVWGALHRMARMGLTPNSPELVERLGAVTRVVFDKTGTLTDEDLGLERIVTVAGVDADWLAGVVAVVEGHCDHPVARPFASQRGRGREEVRVAEIENLPGLGIRARVTVGTREHELMIGNVNLTRDRRDGVLNGLRDQLDGGATRELVVIVDGELAGLAALSERLRPFAASVVRELDAMGIPVEVMTGDQDAAGVSSGVRVSTGLTPEQKATAVRALEAEGERILFVGDGLNDAEAMARATASLALSTGQETARDVALGELDSVALTSLPRLLGVAREARRRTRLIVGFALTYNAVGIAAAAAGWLHPVLAAVIMFASSATVLAMALRGLEGREQPADRCLPQAQAVA